jgi:hypothetical protein
VSEKALRILRGDRIERAAHRFDQCLPASALRFSQDAFYLGEGFLDGVSMRRHTLSRANVVASEATRSNQRPLALRFHPHSVWAGYEWPGARWDPSRAALPFAVRPPANSGGHTPSRSRREQAWGARLTFVALA